MLTSVFLAKLLGLTYLVVGLGVLLNKNHYHTTFSNMLKDASTMYLGGVLSFVIGVLIVMHHNMWGSDWTVIITLFGWLALLKGVVIILSPKSIGDLAHFWLKRIQFTGVVVVGLGLLLSYFGFMM